MERASQSPQHHRRRGQFPRCQLPQCQRLPREVAQGLRRHSAAAAAGVRGLSDVRDVSYGVVCVLFHCGGGGDLCQYGARDGCHVLPGERGQGTVASRPSNSREHLVLCSGPVFTVQLFWSLARFSQFDCSGRRPFDGTEAGGGACPTLGRAHYEVDAACQTSADSDRFLQLSQLQS